VAERLAGTPGVQQVTAMIENGAVVTVVTVASEAAVPAAEHELARFAIASRVEVA
jgi:hypothetical protein